MGTELRQVSMMVCNLSHSPLFGVHQPTPEVVGEVDLVITSAAERIAAWEPDLVVIFAPDHYNGFFYDLMPPWCVGIEARSVGDWDSPAGELSVDSAVAEALVMSLLHNGFDVASSRRMVVDHGFAQPLQFLVGGLDHLPVVPVFVNAASPPLAPVRRVRGFGTAIGSFLSTLDRRILLIGSGGLSHDPPIPTLAGAAPHVAERLIAGRNPSTESVSARRESVLAEARAVADGTSGRAPLAPAWDRRVLSILAQGNLSEFDSWTNAAFSDEAGNAAHEVRNWIAALAALSVAGDYAVTQTYYRTIPEWMCGFGLMIAETR